MTAVSRQDLFKGLFLSAAMVEVDPKAAGWLVVSFGTLVLQLGEIYVQFCDKWCYFFTLPCAPGFTYLFFNRTFYYNCCLEPLSFIS